MRKVIKKVYKFRELDENAKENAINDYVYNLISMTDFKNLHKNSGLYKAYKKTNEEGNPQNLAINVLHFCHKEIMADVKQYEYLENGDVFVEL